jgi:hypothetical protein
MATKGNEVFKEDQQYQDGPNFKKFPTLSPRVIRFVNSFRVGKVGLVASTVPAYVCVAFISSYLFVGCDVLMAVVISSVF